MTAANPAPIARRHWEDAIAAGLAVAVVLTMATTWLLNKAIGPFGGPDGEPLGLGGLLLAWLHFRALDLSAQVTLAVPAVSGLTVGGVIAWLLAQGEVRDETHAGGAQLRKGRRAAAQAARQESRLSTIQFNAGGIDWTLDRIRRSFLILGSIGGGKTQVIWNILAGLVRAKYRLLIIDGPKGDYSSSIKTALRISPWHAGPAWDIASDCPTRAHARELASSLIPVSDKDPLWGNAAGMVFTAILCKLQAERQSGWGWHDIYDNIILPVAELKAIAETYYPPAVQAVADAESKTTQSIVINLTAYMADVFEMALAWRNAETRFSFSAWWKGEMAKGPRIVILQGSGEFQTLAGGYISAIVNNLANLTASPSFPESKTRKHAIVIDEMAQLPRLAGVQKFLEIGRSKGCSAIFATQSPAQLKELYGDNQFTAWSGMVGTKVFVRISGHDDAMIALNEMGEREVYVPSITTTTGAGQAESVSRGWTKEKAPVCREEDLRDLGPADDGIHAIVVGVGKDPVQTVFTYVDAQPVREAFTTNPDFNQPVRPAAAEDSSDDEVLALEDAEQPEKPEITEQIAADALISTISPDAGLAALLADLDATAAPVEHIDERTTESADGKVRRKKLVRRIQKADEGENA